MQSKPERYRGILNRIIVSSKQPSKDWQSSAAAECAEDHDRFVPRRGLRGGHVQTLAGHFLPRLNRLPAPEDRVFQVEPEIGVLCRCHWQAERTGAFTIVIVHGLEGSSESQYVRGTADKAWAAGMNVVRMNVRNCGGTEKLAPTLYHSGLSADVGAVVRTLISEDRLPRIALVGFSMGGNQVLKLAGEWGRQAPPELRAVAAICAGIDLSACADALHLWIETAKLAFADRDACYGDPRFTDVPIDTLLSRDYAAARRTLVDAEKASLELRPGLGRLPFAGAETTIVEREDAVTQAAQRQ